MFLIYTLADLEAVASVWSTTSKSCFTADAILFRLNPVVSGRPVLVPALVRVAVFDIDNELSIMSELASVIVAVVVAIFFYLFNVIN